MSTASSSGVMAGGAAEADSPSARIAVLGAGLSGLRAATRLAQSGQDVCVFEARTRVGGRTRGEWVEGHWMDGAWPVLSTSDRMLVDWARELGLHELLSPLRPLQASLMRGGEARPIDATSLRGAARIPGPPLWERPKLLRWARLMSRYAEQLEQDRPERAAALDYRSLRDHVALYFGRGALEFWLGPEIQGHYGDSFEELSRVALLRHARTSRIGEARPTANGLPRSSLFELASTAADRLDVRLGTAVARVDEEASGGFQIETVDEHGRTAASHFDAVVICLGRRESARVASPLLTPAERDFFDAAREQRVATLAVALEGVDSGLPQEIRIPRREGSAISSIVLEPGQEGGRAPEGRSQLVVRARDAFVERWRDQAGDVVAKNLLSSLELAMPGMGERVVATHLGRTVSPFFGVGAYRLLDNFQKVQRDRRALGRRIYWAGDHLSGPTFEDATRSGERAARALLEDLAVG